MILVDETLQKHGINPDKLTRQSSKICIVRCDYCFANFERTYGKVLRGRKNVDTDACNERGCKTKKREATFLKKYGVKHPSQNKTVNENRKLTFLKKYGVANPFQAECVKQKIKKTLREKYGVDNVAHLDEIKEKKKQTNVERYGVEYPYQNKEILSKVQRKIKERYGSITYGQAKQRFTFQSILKFCKQKNYKPLFSEELYENKVQKLKFLCLNHEEEFYSTLENISRQNVAQCPKCKPRSIMEVEIFDFIKEHVSGVTHNDRTIISPLELDIYVPDKNLAIEFNGLYWHSEILKSKNYHFSKFQTCKDKGIQLFQIYEDEWRDKQDIWKSIINNALGLTVSKIFARKLNIIYDEKNRCNEFFDENHLQGSAKCSKCFSLQDEDGNIYMAISVRKPFTKNKEGVIEIARVASKKRYNVVGGFSKLMKYIIEWAKEEGYEKVLTYSDCRYSVGSVYQNYGFEFIGHSKVGYDYTDFINRYGRFKFRANDGKSEKQIAKEGNVHKIHNCGNYRWQLSL